MVATSRIQFPEDMTSPAQAGPGSSLETYATQALGRIRAYARDEPVSFGLWAFGIGFVLGWRLKPW